MNPRATAFAAFVFVSALATFGRADGPSQTALDEGRERFKRGVELFRSGDSRAALIEFKRAYEVAPSYKIQFNIGQACADLQDYACARRAFERYLSEGGKDVPKDRRAAVEMDVENLRKLVAFVQVIVNQEGAEISVDDVVVGKAPLAEPILVSAGRRRIGVSLAPYAPVSRVIDVAGGDRVDVSIALQAPVVAPPPAPVTPVAVTPQPIQAPPEQPKTNRTPFFVGLGVTALLGAGATVTGAFALSSKSTLDTTVGRLGVTQADVTSAQDKLRTYTITTDVLLGATLVSAIVTTVLFVTAKPSSTARGASTGVWLDASPSGVALHGAF